MQEHARKMRCFCAEALNFRKACAELTNPATLNRYEVVVVHTRLIVLKFHLNIHKALKRYLH